MKHFLVTMVEQLWYTRNKILKGEESLDWQQLSKDINSSHVKILERTPTTPEYMRP